MFTKDIDEYEITYPLKVTSLGELISTNLTTHHPEFNSSSTKHHDYNLFFNISIRNKEFHLKLSPSTHHFIAPSAIIEQHHNANRRSRRSIPKTNCHYRGVIHGQPHSQVALSACNGMVRTRKNGKEGNYLERLNTIFPFHRT